VTKVKASIEKDMSAILLCSHVLVLCFICCRLF